MDKTIIPQVGFDKVKFGQTVPQVKAVLGEPDEISDTQYEEDEPGDTSRILYYDELGISMTFESGFDFRLLELSFESDEFTLGGKLHVGMTKDAALAAADELGLGEATEEDLQDELEDGENLEAVSYDEPNVTLWFEEGILSTIQLGPGWIDDNTVDWPK